MTADIRFYSVKGEYGYMSNFAPYPFQLEGKTWPTVEHYFQAKKFAGSAHESVIQKAQTPMEAARMGRDRSKPLRKDWERVKDGIMREAVTAKFAQHPDIAMALILTAPAKLVEHTAWDAYWGDGGDGSGRNRLGRILMQIRDEMNQDADPEQNHAV